MIIINGTVDSTGILLLDNYTIGNVGESGITEIIISIDDSITSVFKKYHIEGELPDGSSYNSKQLALSADNTIRCVVAKGLTRFPGLVKLWVSAYNDKSTKWRTANIATTRVTDKNNTGGSDNVTYSNDALYELYNKMMTKPTIIDSSASKVYVSSELLTKKVGDEILFDGQTYIYGESAFAYIGDAVRSPNKVVYIGTGVYTEILNIIQEGIQLIGVGDVTIQGFVTFMNANNARVSNITIESIFPLMDDEHECCQGSAIKVIGASFDNFVVDNVRTVITGSGYGIDTASAGIKNLMIQNSVVSGGRYRNDATCDSIRVGVCMNTSILNNKMNGKLAFDDSIDDVLVSGNEITVVGGSALSFSRRLCDNIAIHNNMIYGDKIAYAIQFNTVDSSDLREFGFVSNDVSYKYALVYSTSTVEINPDKFIFANNIIKRGNDSEYFMGDDVRLAIGDGNIISGAGGNNVVDSVAIAGVPFTQKGTTLSMTKSDLEYAMGFGDLAYTDKDDLDLDRVVRTDARGKISIDTLPEALAMDEDVQEVNAKVTQNYEEYKEKVETLESAIKANSDSIDSTNDAVSAVRTEVGEISNSITELGNSINGKIADAVDGLASTDYVSREVASAVDGLASTSYVDDEIAKLDLGTDESAVQRLIDASLVSYATHGEVDTAKTEVLSEVDGRNYATKSEVQAVSDKVDSLEVGTNEYEVKAIVESYNYATKSQVDSLPTTDEVSGLITEATKDLANAQDVANILPTANEYTDAEVKKVSDRLDNLDLGIDEDAVQSLIDASLESYATKQSVMDLESRIDAVDTMTESEAKAIVESYGYTTESKVQEMIDAIPQGTDEDAVKGIVESYGYATQDSLATTNSNITALDAQVKTNAANITAQNDRINEVDEFATTNASAIEGLTTRMTAAEAKLVFNTTEPTKITVGNLLEGTDINGKSILEVLNLILFGVKVELDKLPVISGTTTSGDITLGTVTDEVITDNSAASKDYVGYFEDEVESGEGYQLITPAADDVGVAQVVKIPAEAKLIGIKKWDALTNSWQWIGGSAEASISSEYFVRGDDVVEVIDGLGNITYASYVWNVDVYGEDAANSNYRFYVE